MQPPPTPQQQSPPMPSTTSNAPRGSAPFTASAAVLSAHEVASPAAHRMADGFAASATSMAGYASSTAATGPTLEPAKTAATSAPPAGYRPYYPPKDAVLKSEPSPQQPEPATVTATAATELWQGADRSAAAPARIAYNPIKPGPLPHEAQPQNLMPADISSAATANPAYVAAAEVADLVLSRAYNPLDAAMLTRRSQPQQPMSATVSIAAVAGSGSEATYDSGTLPPAPINRAYNPLRAALALTPQQHPSPAEDFSAAEPGLTQETADASAAVPPQTSTRAYDPLAFKTAAPTFGVQPHQQMPAIGAMAVPMHGAGADFGVMTPTPQYQAHDMRTACRGYYPQVEVAREAHALPSAAMPRLYRPMVHGQHAQHGGTARR